MDGVEGVNSISLNAHKWFLTTLDCCCLWVKDPSALIKSLSTNPEFLKNKATDSKQVVDYKDWQITLSRRFRSLNYGLCLEAMVWLILGTF
jgi:aromatic-L-amino-acid decarboxylase